jgi:hypothetical protein
MDGVPAETLEIDPAGVPAESEEIEPAGVPALTAEIEPAGVPAETAEAELEAVWVWLWEKFAERDPSATPSLEPRATPVPAPTGMRTRRSGTLNVVEPSPAPYAVLIAVNRSAYVERLTAEPSHIR